MIKSSTRPGNCSPFPQPLSASHPGTCGPLSRTEVWHVLGSGSLATLWAVRLFRSGLPVCLILRNATRLAEYRQAGGLTLIEQGRSSSYPIPATTLQQSAQVRRLLVACKAYDVAPALAELQAHQPEPRALSELLLLQNGLGSQQQAAACFPEAHCWFVSSTEGAWRSAPFEVVQAGSGSNAIGGAATPPVWLDQLRQAGIPGEWAEDIRQRLWLKLAINCAINPLTVIRDCRNGPLADDPLLPGLLQDLERLLLQQFPSQPVQDLPQQVRQVIEATAANHSSMLQDVRQQQRTEISYITGHACRVARDCGLELPHLEALHQALGQRLQQLGLPDT